MISGARPPAEAAAPVTAIAAAAARVVVMRIVCTPIRCTLWTITCCLPTFFLQNKILVKNGQDCCLIGNTIGQTSRKNIVPSAAACHLPQEVNYRKYMFLNNLTFNSDEEICAAWSPCRAVPGKSRKRAVPHCNSSTQSLACFRARDRAVAPVHSTLILSGAAAFNAAGIIASPHATLRTVASRSPVKNHRRTKFALIFSMPPVRPRVRSQGIR